MNKSKSEKGKCVHHLVLYPREDETHKKAIQYIVKKCSYCFITHDKDFYSEKDISKLIEKFGTTEHFVGEIKKEHVHVIVKHSFQRTATAFAKELNIEPNYIEYDTLNHALEYIVHYGYSEKVQYDIEDVYGNLKSELISLLNKRFDNTAQSVLKIIQYIESQRMLTYTNVVKWACKNGYWSELRRGGSWLMRCIDEHNTKLLNNVKNDINYNESIKIYSHFNTSLDKKHK